MGLVTIDYHATVPLEDPSNFGGMQYALHLEGYFLTPEGEAVIPSPVPEVSTYAMMLAGLGLVGFVMRGRRYH
ncbi:MAG: PEP-CTERM sorting domain-containing protein [Burkholderiales bacterium]